MTAPLFGSRDEVMICLGCGQEREIDVPQCLPGEIHYKPCIQCGPGVGITRKEDKFQVIHKKKSFRELYERSHTRGGKL